MIEKWVKATIDVQGQPPGTPVKMLHSYADNLIALGVAKEVKEPEDAPGRKERLAAEKAAKQQAADDAARAAAMAEATNRGAELVEANAKLAASAKASADELDKLRAELSDAQKKAEQLTAENTRLADALKESQAQLEAMRAAKPAAGGAEGGADTKPPAEQQQ